MTATVLKYTDHGGGAVAYDVDAGVRLSIEFRPGDPTMGELPWQADIVFVTVEQTLVGQGVNRRSALLNAASRFEVTVRHNIPLPPVAWGEVERALEGAGAF
jgi:hypothetical protein